MYLYLDFTSPDHLDIFSPCVKQVVHEEQRIVQNPVEVGDLTNTMHLAVEISALQMT